MQRRLRIALSTVRISPARTALLVLTILTLTFTQATFAQKSREGIDGVRNFGRVTNHFFRGGQVTAEGVERLAAMGVKTVIDLRDKESPGEAEACRSNGIKYFKFPMNGHETPDDKVVNEILSIIQRAKEPVYVHCSAGKHRAGTITALYRTRVQGWSKDRAWAEQKSYGFGPPEGHPQLYAYVYGKRPSSTASADSYVTRLAERSESAINEDKSSKKAKKKDDDDDEDSSKSKKNKKKDKSLKKADDDDDEKDEDAKDEDKSLKKANDDDDEKDKGEEDEDRDEKVKGDSRLDRANIAAEPVEKAEKVEPVKSNRAGLSAAAGYISQSDAIKRAKEEGAKGDVLKVDLEWDAALSLVTWDVTFSSGTEYEFDAASGKLLATKSKAPAKLAVLEPLALDGSAKRLLSFQEIIRKAEASRSQTVMEMELKQIKGRPETIYEVVLADGTTILYDAKTGKVIELS